MSWQSRVRSASINGKKKRKAMNLNENLVVEKQVTDSHQKVTGNVTVTKNVKTSDKWIYLFLMARVALWALAMSSAAVFVSYYTDTPVPDEIPEKWKVRIIDASMRTYRHMIDTLVRMGITDYFSTLDRKLSDWFILSQMTGFPWGMTSTADQNLKMNDTMIFNVRVKIYEPVSTIKSDDRAVLIFMHGGGWSLLSVDSYDPLIRKVARESGVVIISIDYRLSPQYPYPTPLQDCIDVVNYVCDNYDEFRIDPYRVAIGGDSAGGNMAASISLQHRQKFAMQFLIVPVLQMFNFQTSSFLENTYYFHDSINNPGAVVFVTNYMGICPSHVVDFLANNHTSRALKRSHYARLVDQGTWLKEEFVRDKKLIKQTFIDDECSTDDELTRKVDKLVVDPYLAPLMASDLMLQNLPEAYIVTCGYDFIRDDGIMYAERLKSVGTSVVHKHYKDGFHHAWMFPHGPLKLQVAENIVKDLIQALSERL